MRIYFTAEDLARTVLVGDAEPAIELTTSLRKLQNPPAAIRFVGWRQDVLARAGRWLRMLFDLVPPHGLSPDFLDLLFQGEDHSLIGEVLVSTPRHRLRADLEATGMLRGREIPSWARRLADGDVEAMLALRTAVDSYQRIALAPYWDRIRTVVHADHAVRSRELARRGVGDFLADLHPNLRWEPPALHIGLNVDPNKDLRLQGRGLLLVPSVFSNGPLVVFTANTPALVYPAHRQAGTPQTPGWNNKPLSKLLGRTRAAVLHAIHAAPGATTGYLARHLAISPASASEHATVLRQAGLITTHRRHEHAHHTTTPLGNALLAPETT